MISFKQFIQEKAMNQREFSKVQKSLGDSAKVGFEFEFFVSSDSSLLRIDDSDRDMTRLSSIRDVDGLFDYFDLNMKDARKMESEYDDWKDEKKAEWVDKNLEIDDDEVQEHGESTAESSIARDRAIEEFEQFRENDSDYEFDEFAKDRFGSIYELCKSFDVYPRYGWATDTGDDRSWVYTEEESTEDKEGPTYENIKKTLTDYLGAKVTQVRGDIDDHYENGEWVLMPDGSIHADGNGHGVGAEVASPPLSLNAALKALSDMFKFMSKYGVTTNSSTGLHINISVPEIKNIDPLKLVLFMGDAHVLKEFNRSSNSYTEAQTKAIISNIKDFGVLPKEFRKMQDVATRAISKSKYSAVNISKLKDGYLEFRAAGGADYHKRFDTVKDTILRFVSAVQIACNPELEKNEYLKKVAKLFDLVSSEEAKPNVRLANIMNASEAKVSKDLLNDKGSRTPEELLDFVHKKVLLAIFRGALNLELKSFTDRQKAEFAMLLKKLNVQKGDLVSLPADPWQKDVLQRLGLLK